MIGCVAASTIATKLGFETVVDTAPATFPASFPMSQVALYAGWYEAGVTGPFTRPTVEFMPGAFAYHLHSANANTIRSPGPNWTGALLAKGATITFGSVEEPYLSGTPNPAMFLERLIWNKFSFGEAAYAAQPVLSWQTTVIGDPLYRPFGEPPDKLHFRLEASGNPAIDWSHLRVVNLNQASGASTLDELINNNLDEVPQTKTSAVLQEKYRRPDAREETSLRCSRGLRESGEAQSFTDAEIGCCCLLANSRPCSRGSRELTTRIHS